MLLATDLDGTFLAGSPAGRQSLYERISRSPDIRLVFVTGRGLPLVAPLLHEPGLARPEILVCDVGATVVDQRHQPIQPLMREIEACWPGEAVVAQAVRHIPGIVRQEQPQARRVSFYCEADAVSDELQRIVAELGCDLLYSADRYLDVLPAGVNKGSTLAKLVRHLGIDPQEVLVAGDTLNDLSMYEQGFKGVCVGASEPGLLEATRGRDHVLHADGPGCDGILQALSHFQLVKEAA